MSWLDVGWHFDLAALAVLAVTVLLLLPLGLLDWIYGWLEGRDGDGRD